MAESPSSSLAGRRMLLVGSGILLSRCLGLTRDIVFARTFGTGTVLAAFILAFTVPNLLRALFGEGAFSAAFVPLFSEKLEKEGAPSAWTTACRIISVMAVVLTALVLALTLAALALRPFASRELAQLTLALLPWLMPYGIMICLSAAFAAVLQSVGKFGVPAFSQVLLNIALITAALAVAPSLGNSPQVQVYALVGGVLAAGTFQLLMHMLSTARNKFVFQFMPDFADTSVRRFSLLIGPVLIGAGVVQLNVLVDRCLAYWLGAVATTTLYYSQRLVYLPVGLFGVAMSTVALPAMSRAWARGRTHEVTGNLAFSLSQVMFLTLPATTVMFILRVPLIQLLFEGQRFTPADTVETAWTLLFYLVGIPAFTAAKIATTPFYAQQDTRTPVRIAAVCLALNVVLNLILMQFLRQAGLALATSICSCVNVGMLLWFLRRRMGSLNLHAAYPGLLKSAVAAICAGAAAWLTLKYLPEQDRQNQAFTQQLLRVLLPLAASGMVFLATATMLGSRELYALLPWRARK